jgi:hypothetical protein
MEVARWEDALAAFNHALELDPTFQPARKRRTEVRKALGDDN